ncbi:unnamed protein product [Pipistrellus nathusii]|uniref:Uncharacterized protein n=1 Tax=Pipistrellus nathusii TaxID=59473 RepID=A0ABN9ZEL4_PIPNA
MSLRGRPCTRTSGKKPSSGETLPAIWGMWACVHQGGPHWDQRHAAGRSGVRCRLCRTAVEAKAPRRQVADPGATGTWEAAIAL